MGLPQSPESQLFYRAARQRFEDAELLLEAGRTTGAVYLAGYTVECLLKALILDGVARRRRRELQDQFRGNRAHNIEWLVGLYRQHVARAIPRDIHRNLVRIASWSTDLRYLGRMLKREEADEFMKAVVTIAAWADGRM